MPSLLHYKGDRREFDPRELKGPDMFKCYWATVGVEYDADYEWPDGTKGLSIVELRPVPPAELAERGVETMDGRQLG